MADENLNMYFRMTGYVTLRVIVVSVGEEC